jgi:hypothetical protein
MKVLLEPKLQAVMYTNTIVCDGVEYVINDIVGKQINAVHSSRSDYQNLLKSLMGDYKNNNVSSEEFPHVMDGLLQAEEQLFRFITYFMTGRDGIHAHTALCKVCIARDNEPKLHVYLKDMFKKGGKLCRSEYNIRGNLVTDLTLEHLMQDCLNEANKNKSVFKNPLKRDGADEIIETAKGIFAFMLNLKLSKFDEVRFESQRTKTGDSTCVRSSIKPGIDEIVNDDIRVITGGIMKYLSDTLNWIYPQIIDAALLQSMNVDEEGNVSPNVLNVAESMLELRYRCTQALQFWISEVLVLLNNNIEKGCTSSPEEIKSVSRLYSKLLDKFYPSSNVDQDFFDCLSQQNGTTPNQLQTDLGVALNLLYNTAGPPFNSLLPDQRELINQSLINCFKNQLSSYKTRNKVNLDSVNNQIMNAFFSYPNSIDNKLEDETERNEYASELFALQISSILGEINNVFKREFVPFSSPQTSQRVSFKRIFHSYVYHDVGVPYLTNVVDTKYTSVKKVIEAKSSHPFTIQASDRDSHENRLEKIYEWNRNNPAQTVVDVSEKTLGDALSYLANNDDKVKSFMT